ncbi:uncharacterized protein V6R79_022765 [Siganus canaliculatus]
MLARLGGYTPRSPGPCVRPPDTVSAASPRRLHQQTARNGAKLPFTVRLTCTLGATATRLLLRACLLRKVSGRRPDVVDSACQSKRPPRRLRHRTNVQFSALERKCLVFSV